MGSLIFLLVFSSVCSAGLGITITSRFFKRSFVQKALPLPQGSFNFLKPKILIPSQDALFIEEVCLLLNTDPEEWKYETHSQENWDALRHKEANICIFRGFKTCENRLYITKPIRLELTGILKDSLEKAIISWATSCISNKNIKLLS